jgi:hypothetical protein
LVELLHHKTKKNLARPKKIKRQKKGKQTKALLKTKRGRTNMGFASQLSHTSPKSVPEKNREASMGIELRTTIV